MIGGIYRNMIRLPWHHPMSRGDRFGTYRRIVTWQVANALDRRTRVMPWVNDSRLSVRKGMTGATGNIYYGLHEYADMALFAHFLRPGDLFADVGANVGTYTVLAAKVCGAKVLSFEPAAETAPLLEDNLRLNGIEPLVTVRRVALGQEAGEIRFTRGRDAINKVATDEDADVQIVPVRRADDEIAPHRPVGMKVDVEGAEGSVFAGAAELLGQPELQVIEVETLMPGVREAIENAGFVERWYDPRARSLSASDNHLGQNNHLFVRDEAFVAARLREAAPIRYGRQII